MADQTATNWLDVLKTAIWPAVALIGFYQFKEPLQTFADNISRGSGMAQEIEVGPLKLKLSAQAVQRITPPTRAVALALSKISPNDLERLLDLQENTGLLVCIIDKPFPEGNASVDVSNSYKRMQALGLINIINTTSASYPWCPASMTKTVELTDSGNAGRRYMLSILTQALSISPA